jgi:hypothetical protein
LFQPPRFIKCGLSRLPAAVWIRMRERDFQPAPHTDAAERHRVHGTQQVRHGDQAKRRAIIS